MTPRTLYEQPMYRSCAHASICVSAGGHGFMTAPIVLLEIVLSPIVLSSLGLLQADPRGP